MTSPMVDTGRLTLAPHRLEDFAESLALWADPRVVRFISGKPSTAEEVWQRLLRYAGLWPLLGYGYWVVREKASGRFVGEVGFADFHRELTPPLGGAPEAGWVLAPWAWGQGYATEALRAATQWFEAARGPTRTVCIISPENRASVHVGEKCGYRKYGETTYRGASVLLFERP